MQLQEQQFRLSMSSMKNQITEVIKEDLNETEDYTDRNTPLDKSFKGKNKEEFLNKSGCKIMDVLEVEDEQIFNDSFMQERADIQMEREHENEIKDQLKSLIIRNQKKTEERNENRYSYDDSFFKSKEKKKEDEKANEQFEPPIIQKKK